MIMFNQNFNVILKQKCFFNNVRFKADLAPTENYKRTVDLAYASFQSTEPLSRKTKTEKVPIPLLLLHGILGSKSNFNTLSKKYHEGTRPKRMVYAVDLRNHGDSAHTSGNTYDELILDVLKFLHSMNVKTVSLLGHDIGGRLGMLVALKFPEIVEKLIVSDISPVTTSHNLKAIPDILKALSRITFLPNMPLYQAKVHVVNSLTKIVKSKCLMSLILMNLTQTTEGSYTWRFNMSALLENFEELASFPDIHNAIFDKPVLFVGGERSNFIQESDFPKILKLFPKAELKYIAGAGHWVHAEKPNEFLKITMDFLNK